MKPTQEKDEFFIPLDLSVELETPKSLSNDQSLPLLSDPSLSLKPLRFLGRAAKGILALMAILATWQTVEFLYFLSQTHWSLAAVFGLLVAGLIGLLGKAAWEYFGYQKDFRGVEQLQTNAKGILKARSCGQAKHWLAKLSALYRNKPHQPLLEKALSTLPDYADDAETLQHLDQQLFRSLDEQAIARISRHSQQTAILVAISPLALLDIVLSGWRCLKMLDEICQIYGLRPSLSARMRLLKMTLTQMALAGSTDLMTDQLADLASSKLISTISTQAAAGVGIGFYTARIGIQAMELCRPVPFAEGHRPGMGKMLKGIINSIRARFRRDSD